MTTAIESTMTIEEAAQRYPTLSTAVHAAGDCALDLLGGHAGRGKPQRRQHVS
jgi:hypothetical protein